MKREDESGMWCVASGVIACLLFAAPVAAGEEPAPAAKCEVAEINPVTGHVFCIRPQGAPVDPPPEDIAPPCEAEGSRGQWTWAPTCKEEPKGM
ncbi:MAG: hypothetical protein ACOYB4_00760 [Methyloceanibacter sp.]